jgi:hypothetical protein
LDSQSTLDERLADELGFSPALLAMRVLSPLNASGPKDQPGRDAAFATYEQLCDVGEALARAERPETYPSAENDWKLASEYLRKTVGEKGVDLIKTRAVEHSKAYQETLSTLFKSLEDFAPEENIQKHRKRASLRKNRWLSQCPPEIQASLRKLYDEMEDINSAKRALESLLHKIIPQAGFTGGCVFVVDPAVMALMPRAIFGNVTLRSVDRVALRKTSDSKNFSLEAGSIDTATFGGDLAATALSCAQPVIEHQEDSSLSPLTGMYGSLGDMKRIGVLYLEALEPATLDEEQRALGTFKALRQAIADALRLE